MSTSADFRFIFPDVLNRMAYASQLTHSDRSPVEIPDVREVIGWYFAEMTGGVAYERGVNELWNTGAPNMLIRDNFKNSRNVSSMGWSYDTLPPILDTVLPELNTIPPWADLFDTEAYDSAVGDLIEVLNGQKGFQIANATKLFYQKRPRLVPILDSFNRQVLNIPWSDDDNADVVTPALQSIRRVAAHESNPTTLAHLRNWIRSNPTYTHGLPLSTLRILDILAWGVIRQRNNIGTVDANCG